MQYTVFLATPLCQAYLDTQKNEFTHNALSELLFEHITMSGFAGKPREDTNIMILFQLCQKGIGLLFYLGKMATIFDFTNNKKCLINVLFGHTSMLDIPGNLIVDAKIMNMLLLCQKWY